jgi:hypothetical protein
MSGRSGRFTARQIRRPLKIKEASGALDRDPTQSCPGGTRNLTPRGLAPPGRSIQVSTPRARPRLGKKRHRRPGCDRPWPCGQRACTRRRSGTGSAVICLSAASSGAWRRSVAASNPASVTARLVLRDSSGTAPREPGRRAPPRPSPPLARRSGRRPEPGRSAQAIRCGITPAFRPAHPLPAKEAAPGLNDAPPKGWRSFRRRCFVVCGHRSPSGPAPSRALRPRCEPNRSSSARRVPG